MLFSHCYDTIHDVTYDNSTCLQKSIISRLKSDVHNLHSQYNSLVYGRHNQLFYFEMSADRQFLLCFGNVKYRNKSLDFT